MATQFRILEFAVLIVLAIVFIPSNAIDAQETTSDQPENTIVNDTDISQKLDEMIAKINTASTDLESIKLDGDKVQNAILTYSTNQPIDGVTALTLLLIGSFVVDRLACFLLVLLSLYRPFRDRFPAPAAVPPEQTERRGKARLNRIIVYYVLAVLIAIALLCRLDLALLEPLGVNLAETVTQGLSEDAANRMNDWYHFLDRCFTGLIIIIGAERVAQWLNMPGTPGARPNQTEPVLVSGEMFLRQEDELEKTKKQPEPST
jgi:hypothetical protein